MKNSALSGILLFSVVMPIWANDGATTQLVSLLAQDQMLVCDELGSCQVVRIPFNTLEQGVLNGTGPKQSVRAVWADTATIEQWSKVYVRILSRPVEYGERWRNTLWLGHSGNNVREISIVPSGQTGVCNQAKVISTSPDAVAVEMTLDNYICDPVPGAPLITRMAFDVTDNECFGGGNSGPTVLPPQVPLILLHEERGLGNAHHGESITRDFVLMCRPLP